MLLVFEALLQTRNVTRAAKLLGIRQPATSAALARLRLVLKDPLFVHAAGSMQPTERALDAAPGITSALRQLRESLAVRVPFTPATAKRRFTIASTDYTTSVIVPALSSELERIAPGVDIRLVGYEKGDIPALLDRGDVDLALGVFNPAPERAVRELLCREEFVGVARNGHPSIIKGKVGLKEYAAARHALVSVRRDDRGEIDLALGELGLSRRVAITLPYMLALPAILRSTNLLAALPKRMAKQLLVSDLAMFELPLKLVHWRIEMLWNGAVRHDPANTWIRKTTLAVAKRLD